MKQSLSLALRRVGARTSDARGSQVPVGQRSMRMYMAYSRADALLVTAALAAALAGAWIASIMLGGSRSGGPHLFYIAIALAAIRFAWPAAVATSLIAGALAGPFLPMDVSSGTAQTLSASAMRTAMFVLVGLFIALLASRPQAPLRTRLQDAISSARLLRGLHEGAIDVCYQPIYRLADDRLVSVEALMRWRRSGGGPASPESFILSAERTGAIVELDKHVLHQAAATAQAWTAREQPISISVNLSARTLLHSDIIQTVEGVLAQVGLAPHRLQLEITESALIDDLPAAIRQVEALHRLGVKVAIDDFGSGRASLNYLQTFPVDVVKLDRTIVAAAAIDDRSRRLLEGIVHLCRLLDLQVIAEGVESPDQLVLLRGMNTPMAQGFLLGRPAPADHIETLLVPSSVD